MNGGGWMAAVETRFRRNQQRLARRRLARPAIDRAHAHLKSSNSFNEVRLMQLHPRVLPLASFGGKLPAICPRIIGDPQSS